MHIQNTKVHSNIKDFICVTYNIAKSYDDPAYGMLISNSFSYKIKDLDKGNSLYLLGVLIPFTGNMYTASEMIMNKKGECMQIDATYTFFLIGHTCPLCRGSIENIVPIVTDGRKGEIDIICDKCLKRTKELG